MLGYFVHCYIWRRRLSMNILERILLNHHNDTHQARCWGSSHFLDEETEAQWGFGTS